MDMIFKDITVVTMNDENPVIKNACVGVKNGKISFIEKEIPKGYDCENVRIYNGTNKVLMPGLINAHTHLPMSILRGVCDDADLHTWLFDNIFPREAKLDGKCCYVGTVLSLAEMIASGTTSSSDMYYFCEDIVEAINESKFKINISRGTTMPEGVFDRNTLPASLEIQDLYKKFHNMDNGRIKVEIGLHAEYTTNPSVWTGLLKLAEEMDTAIQVHLSETRFEHNECIKKYGKTPAAIFEEYGVFNRPVVAAHCTHLTDDDIEILKRHKATAVHNAVSNLKLSSGIARAYEMHKRGLNVAIGTDGASSNNSQNMMLEIRTAALVQKLNSPTDMPAYDVLKMATVNGAIAQRRENECGKVQVGMDADLIVFDFDKPHLYPCNNVISNLVYAASGSDVVMTMVRGNVLYENGVYTTIDMEKVKFELINYVLPKIN